MYSRRLFVALAVLLAVICKGDCQSTDSLTCTDGAPWCTNPGFGDSFCNTEAVAQICKKTCKQCPVKGCKGCQHICGSDNKCACKSGYQLQPDNKSCKDVNECEIVNPCSGDTPYCHNTPGSYECLTENAKCALTTGYTVYYQKSVCCKQTSISQVFGKCGINLHNKGLAVENSTLKIVGGEMALTGMWPWMAHIDIDGQTCGGSLINDRWVVTAGHCFEGYLINPNPNPLTLTFGMTNTSDTTESMRQTRKSKQVIVHEQYVYPKYDIALVELSEPVKWSEFVNPICLPNGEIPKVGLKCFATGYGTTAFRGRLATILQQVDLPIVASATCVDSYKNEETKVDPSTMICAGYEEGGKDACQGDSGGPLVCQRCDSCDFFLAGLVSFGKGCALPKQYGVYTHVEKFEDWIAGKVSSVTIKKKTCVKTEFSKWQAWGKCSAPCGKGTRQRLRICINGIVGQEGCVGSTKQVEDCEIKKCIEWGPWTEYGECNATCGLDASQTRSRSCLNCSPTRIQKESRSCNYTECAYWNEWDEWNACSKDCGGGRQRRLRTCQHGKAGDPGCPGKSRQTRTCNKHVCPVPFETWSDWTECTASCGGGLQGRHRSCSAAPCIEDEFGSQTTQSRSCGTNKCPHWGPWSEFGACNKKCDSGTQTQTRECIGGTDCSGQGSRNIPCNTKPCAEWKAWSEWGACSHTCGTATRDRTRICEKIDKTKSCVGKSKETEACEVPKCPEICSDYCQSLVLNYGCIGHGGLTSSGCAATCCDCVDDPAGDCSFAGFGWTDFDFTCTDVFTAYQCKASCGLCFG